jgi:tRNA pseudouridine55 synthase
VSLAAKGGPRPKRTWSRVDGVLLLDKPRGMSSNHALQAARRLLNAEKAGHTGTLDPLATGLLPLCFGEATKFSGELLNADKRYLAELRLGITTDTGDAEGTVIEERPVACGCDQVAAVLDAFRGPIEQVPPMYSALKRDGKPLYAYAREGVELEREVRRVTIHELRCTRCAPPLVEIDVLASKGTYIRTLGADIGTRLGCGAHLSALRRTGVGRLDLAAAVSLDQLEALPPEDRQGLLLPVDALVAAWPAVRLDGEQTRRILLGQALRVAGLAAGLLRLIGVEGNFLGVGTCGEDGVLRPQRLVANSGKT